MAGKKSPVPEVRRAALYIRVSTEEQAKKGYSLPAQKEDLESYAKKNGYAIVGYYIDEGKSARKKYTNRKEFMRMIEDVKADKIDVILFIKLDRWFRSVADYYKIQEILDAHGVAWKTTQEHYDTETTNGRLYINISLSVAQDECDRDSDRIKFVFESKVARGEPITGSMPFGLKIENKRIVRDPETAHIVEELFRHYQEHGTVGGAMRHVRETHGILLYDHAVRRMLRNPMYKGMYRDNPDYCEAIIPPEEFDAIQQLLESRSIRSNPTGRIYIFSGLLVCGACGQRLSGHYTSPRGGRQEYYLYRCRNALIYHRCSNHKCMNEEKLEQWLLLNVMTELDNWQTEWEIEAARAPKPKVDRAAIRRKLERLKDLYVDDLITMEQYKEDFTRYNLMLQQEADEPPPPPDFEGLRKLLSGDLQSIYRTFDREQRRDFWRSIVQEIRLDGENDPRLVFRR